MRIIGTLLLTLIVTNPAAAAQRHAFLDAAGVLMAHGFVETNEPGQTRLAVAEEFNLEPGRWRWTGSAWVPQTPPPTREQRLRVAIDQALADPAVPQRIKDVLQALRELAQ